MARYPASGPLKNSGKDANSSSPVNLSTIPNLSQIKPFSSSQSPAMNSAKSSALRALSINSADRRISIDMMKSGARGLRGKKAISQCAVREQGFVSSRRDLVKDQTALRHHEFDSRNRL